MSRWGVARPRNRVLPVSLMVADLVPQIWNRDSIHAVTASTGIRMSRPGQNDMKPGIDGV